MSRLAEFIRRPPFAERLGIGLLLVVLLCLVLGVAGHDWAGVVLAIGYRLVLVVLGLVALVFLARAVFGRPDSARRR